LVINTLMLPKQGQELCGDGWTSHFKGAVCKLIAMDGLGHGPEAHRASAKAVHVFKEIANSSPAETIKILHHKIRDTRGVVGMVFHIDAVNSSIAFAGLGNISAKKISHTEAKNLFSYNGIIGHTIPATLNSNTLQWQPTDILIIFSDGL